MVGDDRVGSARLNRNETAGLNPSPASDVKQWTLGQQLFEGKASIYGRPPALD